MMLTTLREGGKGVSLPSNPTDTHSALYMDIGVSTRSTTTFNPHYPHHISSSCNKPGPHIITASFVITTLLKTLY